MKWDCFLAIFFVSREQSQYCDYALETKKCPKSILTSSAASDLNTWYQFFCDMQNNPRAYSSALHDFINHAKSPELHFSTGWLLQIEYEHETLYTESKKWSILWLLQIEYYSICRSPAKQENGSSSNRFVEIFCSQQQHAISVVQAIVIYFQKISNFSVLLQLN